MINSLDVLQGKKKKEEKRKNATEKPKGEEAGVWLKNLPFLLLLFFSLLIGTPALSHQLRTRHQLTSPWEANQCQIETHNRSATYIQSGKRR